MKGLLRRITSSIPKLLSNKQSLNVRDKKGKYAQCFLIELLSTILDKEEFLKLLQREGYVIFSNFCSVQML